MNKEGILEGLLYVQGDEGLTINQLTSVLEINEEEAKALIKSLSDKYDDDTRGLRINYLGNTFKLTTKEEHMNYYQKLFENPTTNVLSQASLETLAIIAYNEPITRIKIESLRGVDCTYQVRKLVAKGLIKECGKSPLPGRPTLYKTTDEFLDYFGMSTLDDLPKIEEKEVLDEEQNLFLSNYKE